MLFLTSVIATFNQTVILVHFVTKLQEEVVEKCFLWKKFEFFTRVMSVIQVYVCQC